MIGGSGIIAARRVSQVATRLAAAHGRLVTMEPFPFNAFVYELLTHHHRWLELAFSVGGFGSAEYLLPQLATAQRPDGGRIVPPDNLARFLLIFSSACGMSMDLDESLRVNAAATMTAALGHIGSRFCYTNTGHAWREKLLEWLPDKLGQVQLGAVVLQNIASPYMHCSYAMSPAKHAIKAGLIAQMRRALLDAGAPEMDGPPPPSERPTIVVTTENFNQVHSVHRTHSRAVTALRRAFNVVGVVVEVASSRRRPGPASTRS